MMQCTDDLKYTIALTLLEGIGNTYGRKLIEAVGSAKEVFALKNELRNIGEGFSSKIVEAFQQSEKALARAEEEISFCEKHNIRCATITDTDYPKNLFECEDAPLYLFSRGNINFNNKKIVSIVGTRKATNYGRDICEQFVSELKELYPDVIIVSGLAYGIDVSAHKAALKYGLCTVGILAHGLDTIYPSQHRSVATEMLNGGGVMTEFLSKTPMDKSFFVKRNRIIAGLSDATIVVESAEKGGSLITANLAFDYNRECFAFPGRIDDKESVGCNNLIRSNKATLITSAKDFIDYMRWNDNANNKVKHIQQNLFLDLTPEEAEIVNALSQHGEMMLDEIAISLNKPVYAVSSIIINLEIMGIVKSSVGNRYRMA